MGFSPDHVNSKTFLARLCEQAERYDEMVNYMKDVANVRQTLSWELVAWVPN